MKREIEEYVKGNEWFLPLVLTVLGLFLLWFCRFLEQSFEVHILMINLGATFIVSAVALWVLSHTGKKVERLVGDEIGALHREVEGVGKEFITRSDLLRDELMDRMGILKEIETAGIVHIFENRQTDPNFKKELIEQLECVENEGEILIMTNSGRDFFGHKHDREYFRAISDALKKDVKIRVLLFDPMSEPAKIRATIEALPAQKGKYVDTPLFSDIKDVSKNLKDPDTFDDDINERIKKQVKVRFVPYDPTAYIIRTGGFSFIEQYNKGGGVAIKEELEKRGFLSATCLAGFVPVFMVDNSSLLAKVMESHFNNTWELEEVKKRDLRDKNYYSKIENFEEKERRKYKTQDRNSKKTSENLCLEK
ncbi:MAG: hypothetical protein WBA22_04160 [Candidatus Methanofastidiosia archaeon]